MISIQGHGSQISSKKKKEKKKLILSLCIVTVCNCDILEGEETGPLKTFNIQQYIPLEWKVYGYFFFSKSILY